MGKKKSKKTADKLPVKLGRKIVFTDERKREFCRLLREGYTQIEAYTQIGVAKETVRDHKRNDEKFRELVNKCARDGRARQQAMCRSVLLRGLRSRDLRLALKAATWLWPRLDRSMIQARPQDSQPALHLHQHQTADVDPDDEGIVVIEDVEWYGNKAHDQAAKALGAPDPDPPITGPIQGGSLRETMGQNGSGLNGHG